MELTQIIPHVEALIFASDHPLPAMEIVDLLNQSQGFLEDQVALEQVTVALDAIVEKYQSEFYAFEIKQSGGGFQFLTKSGFHPTVARLNGDKYLKKLSTASLETLSIIAYKQPVTKGEVESIRGVNSDYSIQKLLEKELIIIKGRKEDAPGKPLIYATSQSFMDYFGLNSPDDLPKIKEVVQEELPQPQEAPPAQQNDFQQNGSQQTEEKIAEENAHFSVSENGQLQVNHDPAEEEEKEERKEENPSNEHEEGPDDENEKSE